MADIKQAAKWIQEGKRVRREYVDYEDFAALEAENARLQKDAQRNFEALKAVLGYMLNAKIDVETSTPKKTTLDTIDGGIRTIRAALAAHEEGK